jgi:hypothetical protein
MNDFEHETAVWTVGSITGGVAFAAAGLTINVAINIYKSISAYKSSNTAKEMSNKACHLAMLANDVITTDGYPVIAEQITAKNQAKSYLNLAKTFAEKAATCTICYAPSFWSGAWNAISIIRLAKARSLANEAKNHKNDAVKYAVKALVIVEKLVPEYQAEREILRTIISEVDGSNTPEINASLAFAEACAVFQILKVSPSSLSPSPSSPSLSPSSPSSPSPSPSPSSPSPSPSLSPSSPSPSSPSPSPSPSRSSSRSSSPSRSPSTTLSLSSSKQKQLQNKIATSINKATLSELAIVGTERQLRNVPF